MRVSCVCEAMNRRWYSLGLKEPKSAASIAQAAAAKRLLKQQRMDKAAMHTEESGEDSDEEDDEEEGEDSPQQPGANMFGYINEEGQVLVPLSLCVGGRG